jgi:hypothetical protein
MRIGAADQPVEGDGIDKALDILSRGAGISDLVF